MRNNWLRIVRSFRLVADFRLKQFKLIWHGPVCEQHVDEESSSFENGFNKNLFKQQAFA